MNSVALDLQVESNRRRKGGHDEIDGDEQRFRRGQRKRITSVEMTVSNYSATIPRYKTNSSRNLLRCRRVVSKLRVSSSQETVRGILEAGKGTRSKRGKTREPPKLLDGAWEATATSIRNLDIVRNFSRGPS